MELECDLSTIKNEEMLRKMWQQSEDINRKKEIRSHLYKLRESRLRDLYQGDIMSGNNAPGFGKDPLTPCHGDSLVDQSFQSLKSKEIRDSMSPTHDMKFHSLSLNHPNTTGWDVQTSSEVSPDGRAYRSETLAKTDGVEKIAGGLSEFKGRNEQRSSASHQGDDKNFVKKASESSNTHLQENVVIGDENSGRTEMKMSSTTSSSTSKVVSSSSTLETLGGEPVDNKYLMDNTERHHGQQQQHQHQQRLQQEHLRQQQQLQREHEQRISDQQATKQQRQQQFSEQYNRNRQETNSQQTSSNVETQKQHEESKRYIDMDKATPEYQQHVQFLMAQPGEVISNTVEYPKPNVKMITTVKRLPDGTIVKNKRYETEELRPGSENVHQRSTSTNQSNTQQNQSEKHVRDEENIHTRLQKSRENNAYTERSNLPQTRRPVDVTDNADVVRHIQDRNVHSDDVANVSTSFSSVQKSSRRFSTETTSETIEEYDDRSPNKPATRGAQTPQDFSTHGFPSVRPNKLTQEYPNDRPQGARPSDDFTTHGYPSERPQPDQYNVTDSRKPNSVVNTRGYPSVQPTKDGEMILVSSETTRTANQKTNRERVIETEDFSTQSFPAVKASSPLIEGSPRQGTPSRDYPSSPRRAQPQEDFSTHGFPSVRSPTKTAPDGEVILVSSETKRTANQKTNREHIIETVINDNDYPRSGPNRPENITYTTSPHRPEDFSTHGFPSVKESSPLRDGSPRHGTPTRDYPSSPRRSQPNDNYSTHGFPSARSPTRSTPDYSRGSPSTRDTPKSGVKPTSVTTEATKKLLHKEKETDASHRAFAASLRSSSPIDNTRRDSYSENQRQTPRSSISSTKTFRRDQREGSHDSTAPSETSRISSNTVTRQSPSKSVGKTVVTKQTVVKTKNVNDSNETADLTPQRFTKSPSPAKTITTTTTTKTTTTRKSPTTDVPKSDNQKTKPAEILFPINEPLTITKTHLSSNDASFPRNEVVEVVEEPCLKKHFYRLGPSDNTPIVSDEKSPSSPAPSSSKVHTHPKNQSPMRDDNIKIYDEPINEPSSPYDTEHTDRNQVPSKLPISNPTIIRQQKEPSIERRTDVRETTIEKREKTKKFPQEGESRYIDHETKPDHFDEPLSESDIEPSNGEQLPINKPKKPSFNQTKTLPMSSEPSSKPTNKPGPQKSTTNTVETTFDTTFHRNEAEVIKGPNKNIPKAEESPQKPTAKLIDVDDDYQNVDKPLTYDESTIVDELFKQTHKTKQPKNLNEDFITIERDNQYPKNIESPDGGFFSKECEPIPTSPTFKKKGLTRRETFEERCRQILGMEEDGDTQGTFKPQPDLNTVTDDDDDNIREKPTDVSRRLPDANFEVQIEDCDDEDEDKPFYINNIKETLNIKTSKIIPVVKEPKEQKHVLDTEEIIDTKVITKKPQIKKEGPLEVRTPEICKPVGDLTEFNVYITENTTEKVTREIYDKTDSDMEQEEPLSPNKAQPTKNVNPKSPITKKRPSTSPEPKQDHVVTRKTIVSTYTDDNEKTSDKLTQGKPKQQYSEDKTDSDMEEEEPLTRNKAQPTKNVNPKSPISKKRPSTSPEPKHDHVVTRKTIVSTYTDDNKKTTDKFTQGKPKEQYPEDKTTSDLEQKEPLSPTKGRPIKNVNQKSPVTEQRRSTSPEVKRDHLTTKKTFVTKYTDDIEKTTKTDFEQEKQLTKNSIVSTYDNIPHTDDIENIKDKAEQYEPKERYPEDTIDLDFEQEELLSTIKPQSTKNVNQKSPVTGTHRPNYPGPKHDHAVTRKTIVTTYQDDIEKTAKNRYPSDKIDCDFEGPLTNKSPSSPTKRNPTKNSKQKMPVEKLHSKSPEPKRANLTTKRNIVTTNTEEVETISDKVSHVKPDSSTETDSESAQYTSEIETEQENFISERVINCNNIIWIEEPVPESEKSSIEKPKKKAPKTNLSPVRKSPSKNPSKFESEPKTSSLRESSPIKQKPMEPFSKPKPVDKSFVPSKSVTKTVDDNIEFTENRKTSKSSTIVKTTANHVILNNKDIQLNNKTQFKSPKQPSKETPSRIKSKDSEIKEKTVEEHRQPRKPTTETTTSTMKDRLRSSARKDASKKDDVDANSSPDTSPTRNTERRRSSNISVHTEIIIDHSGPKSPKNESAPKKQQPNLQNHASTKEFTVKTMFDKTSRKMPVTERKESAPVPRVTRKDKDIKMSRSTSENVFKVTGKPTKKPEMNTLYPGTASKTDRRPSKCFTTKTINLTTTNKLMKSDDMENIIIDIQHAKSSREPSPDKIVPTPVPIHLDTGKPRYPDVVQEPEDEPRKKPVVKNIPIFEEDTNDFINCQISEIHTDKTATSSDFTDYEILDNPTVEAPQSLDYPSLRKPDDDDCLLSVHEKVSKFTHTAEEVKKPKASSPFNRDFDTTPIVPENDECLLTVDQKVTKFLRTAESITKHPITPVREIERPNFDDLDEELRQDECILSVSQKVNKFINTAEKLAPAAPQKSPELVARIERNISRQSEPEQPIPSEEDDEPIPFSPNHTVEIEVKRQKDILSRPTAWGKKNQKKDSSEYTKYDVVNQNDFHTTDENSETVVTKTTKMYEDDDDDELVPMTKSHTTSIELKRQKDILSRPSVFESRKAPENVHKKPFNLSERPQQFDNIKQSDKDKKSPRYVEPTNNKTTSTVELKIRKDSPTEITKTDERKVNKHKTSTVSTTRARFESTPKDNNTLPRRKPSTESDKPKQLFSENIKQQVVSKRKPFTEPQQPCDNEIEDNKYQTTETITETTTSHPESYPKTMDKNPNNHEGFLPQSKDHIHRKSFDKKSPNPNEVSHSPTSSTGRSTSTTVTKITERTLKHTPSKTPENEFVEPILEQPIGGKSSPSTPGRSKVITETVATRRNIFEKSIPSRPSKSPTPVPTGRRPSYMDHTKSSLEHTRRDSLEINKNNYSRKSSIEDDVELRPNSAVKFDIPQKSRKEPSISEDINIEEVFELKVLEQLLETVTSYEIRRRIRAQIRLVKKNMINTLPTIDKNKLDTKISSSISSTQKSSTYSSKVHYEETDDLSDRKHSKPQDRSRSPKKETDSLHHVETVSVSKDKYTKKRLDRSHSPDEKIISRSTKVPTDRCRSPEGSTDSQHRVEQDRYTKKPRDRSHSPDAKTISSSLKEVRRVSDAHTSTNRAHTFKEETDMVVVHSPRLMRKQPSAEVRPEQVNKPQTPELSYSPEHKHTPKPSTRNRSPECHGKPVVRERSISPQSKKKLHPRKGSTSPDGKTTKQPARSHSPTTKTTRQHEEMYSTISKTSSSKTTTQSPERKASTPKANEKTPIWADRKNILKNPSASGSTAKKAPFSPTTRTTASATKSVKSTTTTSQQQLQQRQRNKTMQEEDSIISSYGIGPTDENGLPLFGIRALKKKKPAQQPCETTEVTGYVVEEKYYSDNKTKPIVERKQLIYSTNADELEQIKSTVENINSSNDDGVIRSYQKIDKDLIQNEPKAILSGDEEFSTLSSRYTTRRGSVKEMSEKFIRKESSQSITEKSSSYPKAGLILRTNSRKGSVTDAADFFESENYTKTTSDVSHRSGDDDRETEGECEMNEMQRSSRMVTESESECESLNIHREVSKKSSSSSTSTRSFLNTTGESKIVTGVDDVLERMRNADNVVEEGDTAEDQEARSLLNKFLGASVIMRGVETVLPSSTKQTKTTTTYATSDGGDKLRKQAVKTTRVTKTIKSESSSSPVTSTTCAIEEIWDEEILKELLDQAKTYEERRKIRARLRELMAEREEKNHKAGEKSAPAVTEPEVEETEESSASEYEEIIEEVTDSSETEEETEKEPSVKQVAETNKINEEKESNKIEKENLKKSSSVESFKSAEATATVAEENTRKSVETQSKEQADTAVAAAVPEVPQSSEIAESASSAESQSETTDQTDSSEDKGEKEQQHSTSTTEQTETKEKDGAVITTTKVTTRTITGGAAPKPVSPFAKFRQLDKQNSVQSPKSPSTPTTPGGGTSASPSSGSAPIFRFTDPALNARAATVKDQLLQWCQIKTKEYENVQVTNFSASWSDGLAFCALIHHFLPDAFDYSKLTKQSRRHNFELAFTVADEKAGIAPLLDVEDMVEMSRPDWKCVFVYVQSIYRRFRNCQ